MSDGLTKRSVVVALGIAALSALPTLADPTDELARLRQEAARMRESLDALNTRIRLLEGANPDLAPPAANAPAMSPPDKPSGSTFFLLQRNWSEIRPGASKDRVNALLGQPERVMRINGDLVWYYVYPGLGRGSVFFNGNEEVSSAQAPRLGWF